MSLPTCDHETYTVTYTHHEDGSRRRCPACAKEQRLLNERDGAQNRATQLEADLAEAKKAARPASLPLPTTHKDMDQQMKYATFCGEAFILYWLVQRGVLTAARYTRTGWTYALRQEPRPTDEGDDS